MLYFWILFNVLRSGDVSAGLCASFHARGRNTGFRAALGWSAMYVALAVSFAAVLYFWQGQQSSLEFLTGYVLELSLSVDNLFVFLLIFNFFAVPEEHQHRALFWGVLGALILRGVFIGAGVGLIHRFHWVLYVFGSFLVLSGIRFAVSGDRKIDPASNPVVKLVRRLIPVTSEYHGGHFFVRKDKRLYATPLFVVLLMIETTDIIFAVDSIPAILAVTLNAFIVYTSNVFRHSWSAILVFRGFRTDEDVPVSALWIGDSSDHGRGEDAHRGSICTFLLTATLAAIALVLIVSILASMVFPAKAK